MCKKVFCLFKTCLCIKDTYVSLNLVPLYTTGSKNAVSVSNFLAVNSIVG